jgi:predicted esterase
LLAVRPHNPTRFTAKVSGVPVSVLHDVPIFMSAGDADQTATRAVTDHSYRELKNAGFKKVRYEHFAGGHHLYLPHLVAALDWFLKGGGNGSNASPVPSSR